MDGCQLHNVEERSREEVDGAACGAEWDSEGVTFEEWSELKPNK